MIGFLLTVLGVWGTMHLYVLLRLWAYIGFPLRWFGLLALVGLALMLSPIGGIALAHAGHVGLGRPLAWVGMLWSGTFFLFFSVSLLHDAYNGVLTALQHVFPAVGNARLLGAWPVAGEAILVGVLAVYGIFEAARIRTEHVHVRTGELPAGVERIRVAQISDVHLGLIVGRSRLERILKLVRDARPDIIVSTGDLVDAEMSGMDDLAGLLAGLEAPRGKFAITGNHEYYAGLEQALEFTRRAGFTVLLNQASDAGEGVTVVGFEDRTALRMGRAAWDELEVLRRVNPEDLTVVLKHRPFVRQDAMPFTDLQLSGHTHRGQIFPFSLAVEWHYPYAHGLTRPSEGTYLYTSRGTGTWGPPMRLFSPPEVTIVDLVVAAE